MFPGSILPAVLYWTMGTDGNWDHWQSPLRICFLGLLFVRMVVSPSPVGVRTSHTGIGVAATKRTGGCGGAT